MQDEACAALDWLAERGCPVPTKSLGQRGEDAAARFLKRKGYRILARGVDSPLGELDIIAVDGRTIVFVEVKTRTSTDAGHPAEAIDDRKQRRMTQAALAYLKVARPAGTTRPASTSSPSPGRTTPAGRRSSISKTRSRPSASGQFFS